MDIEKDIKKQNHFRLPKDYFDSLPEEVMNRIHAGSKSKKIIFIFKPSFLIPSLAILSAIIILITFFFKKDISSDDMLLSDNEVQQIIENPELYNIDDAAIADKYLSSNIPDELLSEETSVTEDDIKSYLEDNTDVNNIINEF